MSDDVKKISEMFIHRVGFGDSKWTLSEWVEGEYKRVKGIKAGKGN